MLLSRGVFVCYAPIQHSSAFISHSISFLYVKTFSCCCIILSSILLFAVCFPMNHRDASDCMYTIFLMFCLPHRSIALQSYWTEGWHAGLQCQCRCLEQANTLFTHVCHDGHVSSDTYGPCWRGIIPYWNGHDMHCCETHLTIHCYSYQFEDVVTHV